MQDLSPICPQLKSLPQGTLGHLLPDVTHMCTLRDTLPLSQRPFYTFTCRSTSDLHRPLETWIPSLFNPSQTERHLSFCQGFMIKNVYPATSCTFIFVYTCHNTVEWKKGYKFIFHIILPWFLKQLHTSPCGLVGWAWFHETKGHWLIHSGLMLQL